MHMIGRPRWFGDFFEFIMRGNVVDLAVGVVVGAAFTGIVNSLVKDLFTPILGLLIGGIDFSNLFVTLRGDHAATLAQAQHVGAVTLNFGVFLNNVIQFLVISFAVFWVVKLLTRLHLRKVAAAGPSKSEQLLTEIRDLLAERGNGVKENS